MHDAVVIGAGVAGLVAAWQLKGLGQDVLLLEASRRAGGMIRTHHRDGLVLEHGPASVRGASLATYSLLEALGLHTETLPASPAASDRYLWWKEDLHPLPKSVFGALKSPLFGPLVVGRALCEPLIPRRRSTVPETVHAFLRRRLGAGIADRLADAILAGIFASDAQTIEVDAAFPLWKELEASHGSLIIGMLRRPKVDRPEGAPRTLFTLHRGLQRMTDALAEALGDTIRLSESVTRLERSGSGWRVHTNRGSHTARRVIVAAPPAAAADFVPRELRDALEPVVEVPLVSMHLAWRQGAIPRRDGFGWLTPPSERRDALGCIWVSSVFPDHAPGHDLMRVMLGGARQPELTERDPQALVAHALQVLRETQGIEAQPDLVDLPDQLARIPQYPPGHSQRMARLNDAAEGLTFIGWGYSGIGVPHCIEAGLAVGG